MCVSLRVRVISWVIPRWTERTRCAVGDSIRPPPKYNREEIPAEPACSVVCKTHRSHSTTVTQQGTIVIRRGGGGGYYMRDRNG